MFNYFRKLNIYEGKAGKGTWNWLAKLSDDMSDMYIRSNTVKAFLRALSQSARSTYGRL